MIVIIESRRMQLTNAIGQGAAGTVYEHPFHRDQCIKIVSCPDEIEPERIDFLIANPPPGLKTKGIANFAWPLAGAYCEQTGRLGGFSMNRVRNAVQVQGIVNPSACSTAITREWKWNVAIELSRLVQALHLMSPLHSLGDVNQANFLIHRNGRVTAIDLDSTHFSVPSGTTFLCRRHRPEMQPPENVSATAPIMDRGIDQDAFSVFILIHRLLREGLHPFDANYCGACTPLKLHERIEQGIWPDSQRHAEYRPKPGTVAFTSLPQDLQDLFRRMFLDGITDRSKRPDVTELLTALEMHRPWNARTARIGRRAWRRELNPTPRATSPYRRAREACRRHARSATLLAALAAAIVARNLSSGESSNPESHSKLRPGNRGASPLAIAPRIPAPPTLNKGTTTPPVDSRRLLGAPRLWRHLEKADHDRFSSPR